eukprot:1146160-Pelagomonas_calceolata.AAC.1
MLILTLAPGILLAHITLQFDKSSFATDGLHHAHGFQHNIWSANPLDLSQLEVDLRSRHLAYWIQFSACHPRDLNNKEFLYHHWCAFPTKNAHTSCAVWPNYAFASTHSKLSPPTCDISDAQDDVQDEQHVLFKCTHPQCLFPDGSKPVFYSPCKSFDMFTFMKQNDNELYLFIYELLSFYEKASSQSFQQEAFFASVTNL